ncbi:flagellar hook-basal body complex protein FliE [bacterium]|nr:MAG: flagellar hook-basal body complex protein FliE [bacterium]
MLPIEPAESRISSLVGTQKPQNLMKAGEKDVKFTDTLSEFVSDVNSLQIESSKKSDAFIKGEPVDIHDVMISAEKAKTSFELLMELRNKALELYKEVNRMQV